MMTFIKLTRLPNLLIIIITQYLTVFCIIKPAFAVSGVRTSFGETALFLLILITVLITSAAYIINDLFDRDIDKINKPGSNLFDKYNKTILIIIYAVFNLIAVTIGFHLAHQSGAIIMGWIIFAVVILLYLYSSRYKKQLMIGNIIVAFLSAFTIVIVWLFGFFRFRLACGNGFEHVDMITAINVIIMFYAFFAFLLSLTREIVKDIEDIEGDAEFYSKTLPLVIGVKNTRLVVTMVISAIVLLLFFLQCRYYFEYKRLSLFFLFAVQLPLVYLIYRMISANSRQEFGKISIFLKIIMLSGVLSMIFI